MFKQLRQDINIIKERDPAARSSWEVFFLYSGLHAVIYYRIAHWFYIRKWFFIARWVSQLSRFLTGIEIHPGAVIGKGLFIDHGSGVVIGETTEIGNNCLIYQGATLGGTGKDKGKRHPTLGNNVLIGTGAKVLGPFKVGDNARIAANAVVLSEVPPNATAVGIPARVILRDEDAAREVTIRLDHAHIPDPVQQQLCQLLSIIDKLESEIYKIKQQKGEKNEDL